MTAGIFEWEDANELGTDYGVGSRLSALITGLVLKFVHFVFFTTMVVAVVSKPLLVLEMNIA